MTKLANVRNTAMFVSGIAAASVFALTTASAPPARAAGGRNLQVQKINVANGSGIPANAVIEITMSQPVDPRSVTPATVQVRGQNATQTGYTKQVVGSFQVVGNVVRFYPRLPTHLRDATGKFYAPGSALDDASANSGLKPTTGYEVRLIGKPAPTSLRSNQGRPLKNTTYSRFSTAAASPPEKLWTTQSYTDSPPPQFQFSNPPDTVPAAETLYTTHGGTKDVPSSIVMSLFCTKVPLAPGTVRNEGNVTVTRIARKDDYSLRRPIQGTPYVEQNFDTTILAFGPRVALVDLATLSLRVGKGVKDLTEQNDFAPNRQRDQLRQIYDFLAAARALSPGVPAAQFPDPPLQLITDWPPLTDEQGLPVPGAAAARGVLKGNVLALGDAFPDEVDPRTMLIFTTRDEPSTKDALTVEFTKAENIFDAALSTGDIDTVANPSSAVASFTIAGGSGALGDLTPTGTTTISADAFAANTLNYRNVVIPQNVIVNITGTKPVSVLASSIVINGELRVDGQAGGSANPSFNYSVAFEVNQTSPVPGGKGGPGGGVGATNTNVSSQFQKGTAAASGTPGNDQFGVVASAQDGGRGGLGGKSGTSTAYEHGGGGGGGGGMRTAGTNGAKGTYPSYATWNGDAGIGGAAAIGNDDLVPLVGGAGGGGGAAGAYTAYTWGVPGGGGGGGGGAIVLQTSGTLNLGTTGFVRARGGAGGQGSGYKNYSSGPGGGGGGGSILLRSTKGYSIPNPLTQLDVSGGLGGTQPTPNTYTALTGGNGGVGLVRTEDPKGGIAIAGATQGIYDPVGAGVVSFVYTKWIDLGVQDPKILPFTNGSVVTYPQNDAIYVEAQMTTEHPTLFGTPNLSAIGTDQVSTNVNVMSQWHPLKLHDQSGNPAGAFTGSLPPIAGLPANPPSEYAGFSAVPFNGKGYRFIRFRMYFQLDDTQTSTSPLPYVDKVIINFEFNF